jgi:hypothetical protein
MSLQYYTTQELYNTRFTNLYTTSQTYLYKKTYDLFTKLKQSKLNFTCLQNSENYTNTFQKRHKCATLTQQIHTPSTQRYTTFNNTTQLYTTLQPLQLYTSLQLSQLYTKLLHNLDKTLNTY